MGRGGAARGRGGRHDRRHRGDRRRARPRARDRLPSPLGLIDTQVHLTADLLRTSRRSRGCRRRTWRRRCWRRRRPRCAAVSPRCATRAAPAAASAAPPTRDSSGRALGCTSRAVRSPRPEGTAAGTATSRVRARRRWRRRGCAAMSRRAAAAAASGASSTASTGAAARAATSAGRAGGSRDDGGRGATHARAAGAMIAIEERRSTEKLQISLIHSNALPTRTAAYDGTVLCGARLRSDTRGAAYHQIAQRGRSAPNAWCACCAATPRAGTPRALGRVDAGWSLAAPPLRTGCSSRPSPSQLRPPSISPTRTSLSTRRCWRVRFRYRLAVVAYLAIEAGGAPDSCALVHAYSSSSSSSSLSASCAFWRFARASCVFFSASRSASSASR